MQANRRRFRRPCGCGGAMRGASPDEAQPGLHSKPKDAAIGQVLASHCPSGRHGRRFRSKTQNTNKKLFIFHCPKHCPCDWGTEEIQSLSGGNEAVWRNIECLQQWGGGICLCMVHGTILNQRTSVVFDVKVIYHLWVSMDSSVVFSHLASWAIYHRSGKAVVVVISFSASGFLLVILWLSVP